MASNRQYPFQPALPYDEPVEFQVDSMGAGLVRDVESRSAPPESASDIDGVRFEGAAVRKDFGYRELGDPAATRILAIGEHRYFVRGQIRNRVVRARREAGALILELWTGAAWAFVGSYPQIEDNYLSVVSTQNAFVIADGRRIIVWTEEPNLVSRFHEFVPGEFLKGYSKDLGRADDNPECGTPVQIIPAGAFGDTYIARVKIIWVPTYGTDPVGNPDFGRKATVIVDVKVNDVVVHTETIEYTPDPSEGEIVEKFYDIQFNHPIESGDEINLCVRAPNITYVTDPMMPSGDADEGWEEWTLPHFSTEKFWEEGSDSEQEYYFRFGIFLFTDKTATIGFYHKSGAGPWTKIGERVYSAPGGPGLGGSSSLWAHVEEPFLIENVAQGDQFGIHVESSDWTEDVGDLPDGTYYPDRIIIAGKDVVRFGDDAEPTKTQFPAKPTMFSIGSLDTDPYKYPTENMFNNPNVTSLDFVSSKPLARGSGQALQYAFNFSTHVEAGESATIGIYHQPSFASTEIIKLGEVVIDNTGGTEALDQEHTEVVQITDKPGQTWFGLKVDDTTMALTPDEIIPGQKWVAYHEPERSGYSVKPVNFTEDGQHGIEYETPEGADENVIELLSPDAPAARIVFPFGDRLIALRDGEDRQFFAASQDGNIRVWNGIDTSALVLVDTASDPIDDLMGGAQLSAGVAAIFRKRSIARAVETGNLDLPVAVVKWIEHLGTESPFSIQLVSRGIAFLGHDMMPYILTEGGPQPIGLGLKKDFTERLAGANLELVDSAYDSVLGEYYLALPSFESPNISEVWIFEVNTFWESGGQQQKWRKRAIEMERIAMVSHLP